MLLRSAAAFGYASLVLLALSGAPAVNAATFTGNWPSALWPTLVPANSGDAVSVSDWGTQSLAGASASLNITCVGEAGATGSVLAQPATLCLRPSWNPFTLVASRDASGTFICSTSTAFGPQGAEFTTEAQSSNSIEIRQFTPLSVAVSAAGTLAAPLRVAQGSRLSVTFTPSAGGLGESVPLEAACSSFASVGPITSFRAGLTAENCKATVAIDAQQLGKAVCTFIIGEEGQTSDNGKLRTTILAPLYLEIVPTVPLTFTGPAAAVRPLPSAGNPVTLQYTMTTPAGIIDPAGLTVILQCAVHPQLPIAYSVAASAGSTIAVGDLPGGDVFKFARFTSGSTGTVTWNLQVNYSAVLLGSAVSVNCYVDPRAGDSLFVRSDHTQLLLGVLNPPSSLIATAPASITTGPEYSIAVQFAAGLAQPDMFLRASVSRGLQLTDGDSYFISASPQQSSNAILFAGALLDDDADSVEATITFSLDGATAPLYPVPAPLQVTVVRSPQLIVTGQPPASGNSVSANQPSEFSVSMTKISAFPKDGEVGVTLSCTGADVSAAASLPNGATGFSTSSAGQVTFDQTANTGADFTIIVGALAAGDSLLVQCTWSDLTGSLASYFRVPLPFSFLVGNPVQLNAVISGDFDGQALHAGDHVPVSIRSATPSAPVHDNLVLSATCGPCVQGNSVRTAISEPINIEIYSGTDLATPVNFFFDASAPGTATCVFSLDGPEAAHFIAPSSVTFTVVAPKQFAVTAAGGIASPIARNALSGDFSITPNLIPFGSNLNVTVQAPMAALGLVLSCAVIGGAPFPVNVVDTGASGLTVDGEFADWTAVSTAAATWTLAVPALSDENQYRDQQVECGFGFTSGGTGFQLPPTIRFAMGSPIRLNFYRQSYDYTTQVNTSYPTIDPFNPDFDSLSKFDYSFVPAGATLAGASYAVLSQFTAPVTCTRDVAVPHSSWYLYNYDDRTEAAFTRTMQGVFTFREQPEKFGVVMEDGDVYLITCTFGAVLPSDNGLPSRYSLQPTLTMETVKPIRRLLLSGSAVSAVAGAAQRVAIDAIPEFTVALPEGSIASAADVFVLSVFCDGSAGFARLPAGDVNTADNNKQYFLSAAKPTVTVSIQPVNTGDAVGMSYRCSLKLAGQGGSFAAMRAVELAASFFSDAVRVSFGVEVGITATLPTASQIIASSPGSPSAQLAVGSFESMDCLPAAKAQFQFFQCIGPDGQKTGNGVYNGIVQITQTLSFPGKVQFVIQAEDVGEYRCRANFNYNVPWISGAALQPLPDLVFTVLPQSTFTVSGVPTGVVTAGSTFTARIFPSVSLLAPTGGITVIFACTDASYPVQLYFPAGSTPADFQEATVTLSAPTGPLANSQCTLDTTQFNIAQDANPDQILTSASAFQFKSTTIPLNFGPLRFLGISAPNVAPCGTANVTVTIAPSDVDLIFSVSCPNLLQSDGGVLIRAGQTQYVLSAKAPGKAAVITCTVTVSEGRPGGNLYQPSATTQLVVGAPITVTLTPPTTNAGLVVGQTTGAWTLTASPAPLEPITIGVYAPGAGLNQSVFEFSSGATSGTFTISIDAAFLGSSQLLSFSVDQASAPFVTIPADRQLLVSTSVAFTAARSVATPLSTNADFSITVSAASAVRLATNITVTCSGLASVTVAFTAGAAAGSQQQAAFRTSAVTGSTSCTLTASDVGAPFAVLPASAVTVTWTAPATPAPSLSSSSSSSTGGSGSVTPPSGDMSSSGGGSRSDGNNGTSSGGAESDLSSSGGAPGADVVSHASTRSSEAVTILVVALAALLGACQ